MKMVSLHMKLTKFDKEHKEALLDPGALIILGNTKCWNSSYRPGIGSGLKC